MPEKLAYTYDIYVGAPPSKVWKGIVDGEMTKHYCDGPGCLDRFRGGIS